MTKSNRDLTQKDSTFRSKLEVLINQCSLENNSDTPDFISADLLIKCLVAFDDAVNARREWHSRENTKDWAEFKSVPERIKERVMQDMGQASMCWSNTYTRDGIYETEKATEIGERLCQFIMDEIESSKSAVV